MGSLNFKEINSRPLINIIPINRRRTFLIPGMLHPSCRKPIRDCIRYCRIRFRGHVVGGLCAVVYLYYSGESEWGYFRKSCPVVVKEPLYKSEAILGRSEVKVFFFFFSLSLALGREVGTESVWCGCGSGVLMCAGCAVNGKGK